MKSKVQIKQVLKFAIVAALISALGNNLYMLTYEAITGLSFPEVIHFGSVTLSSVLSALFGGILFFFMAKFFHKGKTIFMVLTALFTLASLGGPMAPELPDGTPTPDGFAALTLPMHLISGLIILLVIPRSHPS